MIKIRNKQSLAKALTVGLVAAACSAQAAFNATPPTQGAYETGQYRDLAAEMGKTNGGSKLTNGYNKMFGTNGQQQLYYAYSENGSYKAHYIRAINPIIGDDIRSEGQSWGMTIAVMMDDQQAFDNLWRFAKNYMKNPDDHSDPAKQGVYAWQLKFDASGKVYKFDEGSAPDGEEYFAFALLNADARWGSNGEFNYYQDAQEMLQTIKNKLMENSIIRFTPYIDNLTDPSYHIPAFYDYFADRLTSPSEKSYWSNVASTSRTFLQNHFDKVSGSPHWDLPTYLARLDGSPVIGNIFSGQPTPGDWYERDAWRVVMNVAMDAHLMGAESWHSNAINSALGFFSWDKANNGDGCYKQVYAYGADQNEGCAGEGQRAANAVALLASTVPSMADEFFNDFWTMPQPTGDWRYYNGSLYMLAMLQVTGNFKFYTSSDNGGGTPSTPPASTRLRNSYSNKCLDAAGTSNGANVQQWSCWSGQQQQWTLLSQPDGSHALKSNHSNRCMTVSGGSTSNGANINQATCDYSAKQKFWLQDQGNGFFSLKASHSNKCVDVAGPSAENGANIQQYACHGGGGQQFKFD
ncbi:hypothetical protein GCM10011369_06280 [Neiella marina]|uniref:cellulase n=1 Tax=Neiella marina TaxID=508461 RepID=A0A8J2U2N3_9GAMM|nr:glycosyl hydrolase family 8 [Neiella marina]GGA67370.1 hypothetical protein GCM10011369_06280 [Neiella marina]